MDIHSLATYDYLLPQELIAHKLKDKRDESRLMVVDRMKKSWQHGYTFKDLTQLLDDNYVIVRNNTRVFPAKLVVSKKGSATLSEMLFVRAVDQTKWEVLVKNSKAVRIGDEYTFYFGGRYYHFIVTDLGEEGIRVLDVGMPIKEFMGLLESTGLMPLPPYIEKDLLADYNRDYQTVYAKETGSVAAPTAGFHFTDDLIGELKDKGVVFEDVTLHVGIGTFMPVRTDDIREHKMHHEMMMVDKNVLHRLNEYKKAGKKILAVGTTSVRFLESLVMEDGLLDENKDMFATNLFIYPGFKFGFVDELITNYHLPKSTLLMLVASFLGAKGNFESTEKQILFLKDIYQEAVKQKYKFYSFGDAMLVR